MQSINAGFHTLRVLMPHLQGEKLSKVRYWIALEPVLWVYDNDSNVEIS